MCVGLSACLCQRTELCWPDPALAGDRSTLLLSAVVRSVMGNLRGNAQKSVHRLAAGCRLAASETEELHLKEWEQF